MARGDCCYDVCPVCLADNRFCEMQSFETADPAQLKFGIMCIRCAFTTEFVNTKEEAIIIWNAYERTARI
jgi:hypothetical protein